MANESTNERVFEQACIDLATNARDGRGLQVLLGPQTLTADGFRKATHEFMKAFDEDSVIITVGADPGAGEAAYWDNLALLARATAAAIRFEEAKSHD